MFLCNMIGITDWSTVWNLPEKADLVVQHKWIWIQRLSEKRISSHDRALKVQITLNKSEKL